MRRLFFISLVLALVISAAVPDLLSAYGAQNMPMLCHRSALHHAGAAGMAHQHCHDMDGMDSSLGTQDGTQNGREAVIGLAGTACPMECCILAGPASVAVMASALVLATPVVIEGNASVARVVFGCSGFSSHTDRGPPSA